MIKRDTYTRALQAATAEARLGAKRRAPRDELLSQRRGYGRQPRPTSPAPQASARSQ